jgi:midasin
VTASTRDALRELAYRLTYRLPILLSASPASGKTLVITHAAAQLHPDSRTQIVRIHLADTSIDARSLLGSHAGSPSKPGSFEWREGAVIRAMKEGKWLVLEDIDKASGEVLATLWPLVESLALEKHIGGHAQLQVHGRGLVRAKEGFALFATRSVTTSTNCHVPSATFLGAHKWYPIVINTPTAIELHDIIRGSFAKVPPALLSPILEVWFKIQQLANSSTAARHLGTRDLVKWCTRIESLKVPWMMDLDESPNLSFFDVIPNSSIREEVFVEGHDVFLGAMSGTAGAQALMTSMASTLATALGFGDDRLNFLLAGRVPEWEVVKGPDGKIRAVHVGRIRLPAVVTKGVPQTKSRRPFALHKPSLQLLARLATCVALNEPVLLAGETGTGKTTAVSYLASLLSRPLLSLNLSQQTESSDLLGGFKPVDPRIPAAELQRRFQEMFTVTFSREKNLKFEEAVRSAVSTGKWKRAVALWKECVKRARDRIQGKQEG